MVLAAIVAFALVFGLLVLGRKLSGWVGDLHVRPEKAAVPNATNGPNDQDRPLPEPPRPAHGSFGSQQPTQRATEPRPAPRRRSRAASGGVPLFAAEVDAETERTRAAS
jgi:hypothetical protein